jgi:hypothetical protein
MPAEMIACYFAMKMPCWRNVMFEEHHNTNEMTKITMKLTWGRIKS